MLGSMRVCIAVITAIVLLACSLAKGEAAVSRSFAFQIARAPHPLALDPALGDPAWAAGKVPGDASWENVTTRSSASEATTVYLLYDDTYLYVAFVAQQQSEAIIATQTTNDVGFGIDDFVGIGIDPSGTGSQAYFFESTPRGVRYEQATENARFRPNWRVVTSAAGGVWRAAMAIPLNVMRVRAGSSQTWRVTFVRNIAARGEHLSWAYDPTMQDDPAGSWPSFGDVRFWPSVTGFTLRSVMAARPKPRLEVYGLSSIGGDRRDFQQAGGEFLPESPRATGLDFSYPITPTINFVGTANPDFSNVEIDQQTIAPQEFQRQLVEYRPFFAQGAQYVNPNPQGYTNFNAPKNTIFYSPSVGPFDSGAKIEGTYGLQSIGVLSFHGFNEVTGETFDDQAFGYNHALPDRTFQYWLDGVLAHHSMAGSDSTYELGTRGRNVHSGLWWLADTSVEHGAYSRYGYVYMDKANYQAILQYADISPNYHPIDGFTSLSDVHGFSGYFNLTGRTPGVKNWSIFLQGSRVLNHRGAVHEADTSLYFTATFKNGLSINGLGPATSYLLTRDGTVVPFNLTSLPLGFRDGTPAPVDISANWGSFGGNWLHFYTFSTSRPIGRRLSLGFEYDGTYERNLNTGLLDSQFLRRISLGLNLGAVSNITLSLRDISGLGGFATQPGLNFAAAYHAQFRTGDLYLNFGSPSANVTLNRTILKYVWRIGGDAGT